MITVDDILKLEEWIARGKDEAERKRREEEARQQIFPDGIGEDEVEERKQVVARAKVAMRQKEFDESLDPMPTLSVPLVPVSLPSKWEGLISKGSKARRRGSIHDGTLDEVKAMRREARGSPFDVDLPSGKK